MTGPTYGSFEVEALSGPRFAQALKLFDEGRSFIFEGVSFAARGKLVECCVLSSWTRPTKQAALAELDRGERVLAEVVTNSPEFASRVRGRARVFLLVMDTGMSSVVLAERRDGEVRWNPGMDG